MQADRFPLTLAYFSCRPEHSVVQGFLFSARWGLLEPVLADRPAYVADKSVVTMQGLQSLLYLYLTEGLPLQDAHGYVEVMEEWCNTARPRRFMVNGKDGMEVLTSFD